MLNYRRLKGIAQRTVKNAASSYWKEYCSTVNSNSKLSAVWRRARKMRGIANGFKVASLTHNNLTIANNKDKANLLDETFAQFSSDSNYSKRI